MYIYRERERDRYTCICYMCIGAPRQLGGGQRGGFGGVSRHHHGRPRRLVRALLRLFRLLGQEKDNHKHMSK